MTCALSLCLGVWPLFARNVTSLSGDAWTVDGEPCTVPHTWNAVDGADGFGDSRQTPSSSDSYERRVSVYARRLPDPSPGKRYFVRCDGASVKATVRMNGKEVGRHVGAFTAFVFEVTSALKDSGNMLEIEVDSRFDPDVPPYSADFTMYGGLYRDVSLVETGPVCFDSMPDGGPGVVVDADSATGTVRVTPRVSGAKSPVFAVRVEGPGLDGPVSGKGLAVRVSTPRLWTPETPNVYTATVVVKDGESKDKVTVPFGFRSVGFGEDGLFRLNGKVRKIRGVNYHQDREGKGWATSAADRESDVRKIKELGADGIRTAHYPHSGDVYDWCDRLGLLAWIEMPNVNIMPATAAYHENAMRLAAEVVAQYRHHPSIFLWSTSNEIKLIRKPEENAAATALEREVDAFVRKTDPSRPTALATFKPKQTEFNAIPVAVGFNFYPGWYRSEPDKMGESIDEALAENPTLKSICVSEYGAGATPGQFETPDSRNAAGAPFHSEGWAARVHHENYRGIAADPRVWGSFVWLMFDFGSDTRREGGRFGLNDKGLVGFDHETKKAPYWLYKANWTKDPTLRLVGEGRHVTTNESVTVMAFSNVGDATLRVNGKVVGAQAVDEVSTAVWRNVKLRDGDNEIRVEAGGFQSSATWRLARPVTLHVSPAGSDASGDGSAERPFATPNRARDELRRLRSRGKLYGGATVVFADGTYRLDAPLELDLRDHGTDRFPIVWKAANRGKAILSGEADLEWKRLSPEDPMRALIPKEAAKYVLAANIPGEEPLPGFTSVGCFTDDWQHKLVENPIQIYQGGGRLECARWPNEGWTKMGRQHGTNTVIRGTHEVMHMDGIFEFHDRPRLERWAREPDLWAHGCWYFYWADSREKILSVDPARELVTIDKAVEHWGFKEGNDFYAINAFSELDRPGEWAVDRKRRMVYAWPVDGAGPMTIARLDRIAKLYRTKFNVFDGLVFSTVREEALEFYDTKNVKVVACTVCHTGKDGVRFNGGLRGKIEGCDVFDTGESGIILKGGNRTTLVPAAHHAHNCHVHHFGRTVPNRPGVKLEGVGCRIDRSLVHHGDQNGIHFNGNDHYIGYNICHDLCQHNDDNGSIYGYHEDLTARGTIIEYNVIHMTGPQPRAKHVNAIYLDAWTSGVTVRGNLINRAPQGIWSSGGQANVIEKNVIMNCQIALSRGNLGKGHNPTKHVWSRGNDSKLMRMLIRDRARYEAPPWRGRYRHLLSPLELDDPAFAVSALWAQIRGNMFIASGRMTCHYWETTGEYTELHDNESMVGDPGFVDYFGLDWSLKSDSSLRTFLGGDTRFASMGLYDSPDRATPAVKFSPDVTPARPLVGEFNPPEVRVDFSLYGKLPDGVADMATELKNCDMPHWGHGKRVCFTAGEPPNGSWQEYSFSFTPAIDGTLLLELMGSNGEPTFYDDFRVEGVEIKDPGCNGAEGGWRLKKEDGENPLFAGGVKTPYGFFDRLPHLDCPDYVPAEGLRFAAATATKRVSQSGVKMKKGVRVTVRFKAQAYVP